MSRTLDEGLRNASILINLKKYDLAIKELRDLLSSFPEEPQSYFYIALAYYHKGDLSKSELIVKECLKLNPNSMGAFNLLGIIYLNSNKQKLAKENLRKALNLSPQNVIVLANLGKVAIIEKDFAEAKKLSEQGLSLDSSNEDCLNNLFWAYTLEGKYEKASQALEKNLAKNPGNVHTLIGLGHQCYREHKFREAQEVFESVLSWDSNYIPGLNGLKISSSANNWFTRALLYKSFLVVLQGLLIVASLLLAFGIDSAHNSYDGYFFTIQAFVLVFTIPFFGIATGRIGSVLFKPRLRHLFQVREILSVIFILFLFALNMYAFIFQLSNLIEFYAVDWRWAAFGFCGSLILLSFGFRMDVTKSSEILKDVSIMWLSALYISLVFIELNLLWLVVSLFLISSVFDILLSRGKLRNNFKV